MEPDRNTVLTTLYEQHYDEMVLRCLATVHYAPEMRMLVEECVQDTFLKSITKYEQIENHPDLSGWLFLACYRRMCNIRHTYLLRKQRHAYSFDAAPHIEMSDPIDLFQKLDEADAWADCLERIYELLLGNEKQIFDDYFLHHASLDEVAKRSGRTKSSIKSVIFRVRQRLDKKYVPPLIIFFVIGASFQFLNNWIKRGR